MKIERKTLMIQPKQTDPASRIPYPFFVDCSTLDVLRQDFWRGMPKKFVGLMTPDGDLVFLETLMKDNPEPEIAESYAPCFSDSNGILYRMICGGGFTYFFHTETCYGVRQK